MKTLSPNQRAEVKVLAFLASASEDFGCFGFRTISKYTRLNRRQVRLACRSLARKGLSHYARTLWTDDGEPAGAGYGATSEGRKQAVESLVERYANRRWH